MLTNTDKLDARLEQMGKRDAVVAKDLRQKRPDLLALSQRTRARWDLLSYARVSLNQSLENSPWPFLRDIGSRLR